MLRATEYIILFLIVLSPVTNAQVGIGTQNPSEKSAVDIRSQINGSGDYKGILIPRVPTEIARGLIPTQVSDTGMLVFVLTTGCLDIFNGTFWEHINCTSTTPALPISTDVWINEFHYDNQGTDIGEFIEISGVAGTNLTGYTIVLYNGANGLQYNVSNLSGVLTDDTGTGYGFEVVNFSGSIIQNGAPDGIALVDNSGIVLQFISYEGSFTASNGAASGLTTTVISTSQTGDILDPIGASLQLLGTGNSYADFTWFRTQMSTSGSVNTGQTIN